MLKKLLGFFQPKGQPSPAEAEPDQDTESRSPDTPQHRESAFAGEHFEGLGDVWEALLGSDKNFIKTVTQFALDLNFPKRSHHIDEEGNLTLLTCSPAEGDITAGVLNTRVSGSDELQVRSCYPLLQGYPNALLVNETHTWANGLEGVVAAQKGEEGPPVDFFAPLYFLDHKTFAWAIHEKQALITELGAVAFSLQKAEVREYAVDEGPLYETLLQQFLEENPDKTQADFEAPVVSTQGLRMLMPTQYVCEWAYRCPVEAMEELTFHNKPFLKLTVSLVGVGETEMRAYLYVSEAELNGYRPSVGDDIEGVLWMSGSIAYEMGEEVQTDDDE